MRILIVNGFSNTPQGRKQFASFEKIVREAFSGHALCPPSHMNIDKCDYSDIDAYLYEPETYYRSEEAKKRFDHIDIIIIDGRPSLLPWLQKTQKFLTLLRMCKRTRKLLFCAGFALPMLIFLCSSKFHISKVVSAEEASEGGVYLENSTGDIYAYDEGKCELLPIANAGIHKRKAAEEQGLARQAILRPPTYVPKKLEHNREVVPANVNENTCTVLKAHVRHWLVQGIGLKEFIVTQSNTWDIHPVNATSPDNLYTVLAETSQGPVLVSHQNAVGSMFHITQKHQETQTILRNFVKNAMERLYKEQYVHKRLSEVQYSLIPCKPCESARKLDVSVYPEETIRFSQSKRPMSAYSGFAVSRRNKEIITVENNATSEKPIAVKPPSLTILGTQSQASIRPATAGMGTWKIRGNFDTQQNLRFLKDYYGIKPSTANHEVERESSGMLEGITSRRDDTASQESEGVEAIRWDIGKIRDMLHPGYNVKDSKKKIVIKPQISGFLKPKRRVTASASCLNFKSKTMKHPFIGTVQNDTPYTQTEQIKKKLRGENRNNWVSTENFKILAVPKKKTPVRTAYEQPYKPPVEQFRTEHKEKWLAGPIK